MLVWLRRCTFYLPCAWRKPHMPPPCMGVFGVPAARCYSIRLQHHAKHGCIACFLTRQMQHAPMRQCLALSWLPHATFRLRSAQRCRSHSSCTRAVFVLTQEICRGKYPDVAEIPCCRVSITFIHKDGSETVVNGDAGMSLLTIAQRNNLPLEGACLARGATYVSEGVHQALDLLEGRTGA